MRGVPPAGATFRNRQAACPKDDNGSDMRGVPSDTAAAFEKLGETFVLRVSGGTVSQSTKKAPKQPNPSYARAAEGMISPRDR